MKKKQHLSTVRSELNFEELVKSIQKVHYELSAQAGHAVNISLTMRNWLIGCYIAEYELSGADRARYGKEILQRLATRLNILKVKNSNRRQLYDYLKFYRTYPQIVQTVSAQSITLLPTGVLATIEKVQTVSAQLAIPPDKLLTSLSYSMFRLLVEIDDETQRKFYEVERIQGNWSVRELKRQINSLYYERSGLSTNKSKLAEQARKEAETNSSGLNIRDPYIFEFLGLKSKEVMSESHLEDELLDKIQEFLLELGHGFCFEARQKRILIGNSHNFVDLVFYHRILKCHVLVELKLAEFNHENIGQLNTYVNWYSKNMMSTGDNPPVGILLCTAKDHALVEYALAGMDDYLFVSKYQLELPRKEEIQKFIEDKLQETKDD
jgi:predicted nuclease of restriction endonuclease-like (RecB) superfamily